MKPAPPEIEYRSTRLAVECRSVSSRVIGGYAAVFGSRSDLLGGFTEQVAPSFFNKSCADGWPGVVCRYAHKDEYLLGATRSGTLKLDIDATGLGYAVDLPECRSDVLEMVRRGDIANSSFAFQCFEDEWQQVGGQTLRTLLSGRLIDVAPVSIPAYRQTSVALRSLANYVDAPVEDVIRYSESGKLSRFFTRNDNRGVPQQIKLKGRSGRRALIEVMGMRYPHRPLTSAEARAELTRMRYPQ